MSIDSSIQQQLNDLRQRIEGLEAHFPIHARDSIDPALELKAVAITRELFPKIWGVDDNFDPSEPKRRWRVIYATPHASEEETERAKAQWRRRMFDEFGPDEVWRFTICVTSTEP